MADIQVDAQVGKAMTDTTPNCKECQSRVDGGNKIIGINSWCTRFPEWKLVSDSHYCGEFNENEEKRPETLDDVMYKDEPVDLPYGEE